MTNHRHRHFLLVNLWLETVEQVVFLVVCEDTLVMQNLGASFENEGKNKTMQQCLDRNIKL